MGESSQVTIPTDELGAGAGAVEPSGLGLGRGRGNGSGNGSAPPSDTGENGDIEEPQPQESLQRINEDGRKHKEFIQNMMKLTGPSQGRSKSKSNSHNHIHNQGGEQPRGVTFHEQERSQQPQQPKLQPQEQPLARAMANKPNMFAGTYDILV